MTEMIKIYQNPPNNEYYLWMNHKLVPIARNLFSKY